MRAIQVELPPARRVLDIGCGTGWVMGEAHTQGPCLRVGMDTSVDAMKRGRRQYPITFAAADGTLMPFADDTFDVVIGHVSMPYMNTQSALQEIFRVLVPGGSVFLTFHSFGSVRSRFGASLRRRNGKDLLFCAYMALNGVFNHFGLPQFRPGWNRNRFETVNSAHGVCRTARKSGFVLTSAETSVERIFFAFTARKPNGATGPVLPAPAWAIYCPLAESCLVAQRRARAAGR